MFQSSSTNILASQGTSMNNLDAHMLFPLSLRFERTKLHSDKVSSREERSNKEGKFNINTYSISSYDKKIHHIPAFRFHRAVFCYNFEKLISSFLLFSYIRRLRFHHADRTVDERVMSCCWCSADRPRVLYSYDRASSHAAALTYNSWLEILCVRFFAAFIFGSQFLNFPIINFHFSHFTHWVWLCVFLASARWNEIDVGFLSEKKSIYTCNYQNGGDDWENFISFFAQSA